MDRPIWTDDTRCSISVDAQHSTSITDLAQMWLTVVVDLNHTRPAGSSTGSADERGTSFLELEDEQVLAAHGGRQRKYVARHWG
jgi:hypothetical protein